MKQKCLEHLFDECKADQANCHVLPATGPVFLPQKSNEEPYMVTTLPYVNGGNATEFIRQRGTSDTSDAIPVGLDEFLENVYSLIVTVNELHKLGILYRILNPQISWCKK